MLELTKQYICPYCGCITELHKYMQKYSSGEYQTKFVKCPICEERMKLQTLTSNMGANEWGEWLYLNTRLYDSPHYRFRDKIHWEPLLIAFSFMNPIIKQDFWNGYNKHRNNFNYDIAKKRLLEMNLKHGIFTKNDKTKLDLWG